jgi:hypothetical protein
MSPLSNILLFSEFIVFFFFFSFFVLLFLFCSPMKLT